MTSKTLWVSPDATWALGKLSRFVKKKGCGQPVTIDFLLKNANPKLSGQVWIALNSFAPNTDTYQAFARFLLPGGGSKKSLTAVEQINHAYAEAAKSASEKHAREIDKLFSLAATHPKDPLGKRYTTGDFERVLTKIIMSEPLLKGVVSNKRETKKQIKLNAWDFKRKRGWYQPKKRMFDQRLESINKWEDLDSARHLINNDALVFYKGKRLAVSRITLESASWYVTDTPASVFVPFSSIGERIQNFKGGWDYLSLITQFAIDVATVALLVPAVKAGLGAKAIGLVTLTGLKWMTTGAGVYLYTVENGLSLLEEYARGRDIRHRLFDNLKIDPVGFQVKEFKSTCKDKEVPEESYEEVSPSKCEKEWSDLYSTIVETCTDDFDEGFQYEGKVSVDSSSRTQVSGNQRRDRFQLTRLDGDSGSSDPFIPKLTTGVQSNELVRLWVTPIGLPTWSFIFYGTDYMEARRRCLNKTRMEGDQLTHGQVEKMYLDELKRNSLTTFVNGVYNGSLKDLPYRIDFITGSSKTIDITKAEAIRALPENEDWADTRSWTCTESIYPDERKYELEFIPMAYSIS